MKRNILARRAASAALAACMMFTLSAPALAASTDALLQQSTAAKSAVSVLDEENGTEVETEYQMNLKYGSIRVYIEDNGKQYVQQGDNEAQQRGNLYITTDGGRTTNTLTIEGGTIGAKVTLSNVNIETTSDAAVSVSGNVELIIAGTNTNTLRSGTDHAGVEKADDNGTLTISGTGTGTLEAYGGQGGAGTRHLLDKLDEILFLVCIVTIAFVVAAVVHLLLVRAARKILKRKHLDFFDSLFRYSVFRKSTALIPPLIVSALLPFAFATDSAWFTVSERVTWIYFFIVLMISVNAILNTVGDTLKNDGQLKNRPIKGFIQIFQVIFSCVVVIVVVSILIDKSPVNLITGLGA